MQFTGSDSHFNSFPFISALQIKILFFVAILLFLGVCLISLLMRLMMILCILYVSLLVQLMVHKWWFRNIETFYIWNGACKRSVCVLDLRSKRFFDHSQTLASSGGYLRHWSSMRLIRLNGSNHWWSLMEFLLWSPSVFASKHKMIFHSGDGLKFTFI